jgi:hypothetical protein
MEDAVLRGVLIYQTQDQGIEAVRPRAGRDDYDQHKGIKRLREVEPIVDAIRLIDRLVELDPLPPGRDDGDEDDDKQPKRGKWRQEPDEDTAAGGELDRRHPPLIKAHGRNTERLEFVDERPMARRVEQLVVARQHKKCPNCDPVQGDREVGPSDASEHHVYHSCCSFRVAMSAPYLVASHSEHFRVSARPIERARTPARKDRRSIGSRERPSPL